MISFMVMLVFKKLVLEWLPILTYEVSTPTPEWASFEFAVEKWIELLREMEVDARSQQGLFLLAQRCDNSKRAASKIMKKLLWYRDQEITFKTSSSAFVHDCIVRVWGLFDSCTSLH